MTRARTASRPILHTWPQALASALAEGFTHVALRRVGTGDGRMIEHEGAFLAISAALDEVAEHPEDFTQPLEHLALPLLHTTIPEGPFAGTVLATYECERRPSVWHRLRAPGV